jgi:hypothetical protein
MRVTAVYRDRVFMPREPVNLAEGTEVDVVIPERPVVDPDDPTGWKAAQSLIGCIEEAWPVEVK